MDNPAVVSIVSIVGTLVVIGLILYFWSGANGQRLGVGLRSLGRALRDQAFADKVRPLLEPPPPQDLAPPKPSGVPLRLLALLQREGRLLDFLLEDVQAYSDDQVGAAVRDIHRQCQAALKEHLVLEPVLRQSEGDTVDVPAGFDPSAIRLTGNVTGQPPFQGTLQHHGWRVKELKLAPPPEGQDEFVLQPAEVELPGAIPPTPPSV
jgi:hypothetical protein